MDCQKSISSISGLLLAVILSACLLQGFAPMTAVASPGVIYACVNRESGNVRIVGTNVGCKNNETPINWNVTGPSGGMANIPMVSLTSGETQLLLTSGPFTVVASCQPGPNIGEVVPALFISTSEDGSAFANDNNDSNQPPLYLNGNFNAAAGPQLLARLNSGAASVSMMSVGFSAVSPSGVQLNGQLWLRQNTLGADRQCFFGGAYAA